MDDFEMDCGYAKKRITLRHSPDMKMVYLVYDHTGKLKLVRLLIKFKFT